MDYGTGKQKYVSLMQKQLEMGNCKLSSDAVVTTDLKSEKISMSSGAY